MDYQQKRIIRDLVEKLEYCAQHRHEKVSSKYILEQLKQFEEIERTQIAISWCVEDVLAMAEYLGVTLTEEQCIEVLRMVEDEHDADIGVNWDVLRATVQWYVEN